MNINPNIEKIKGNIEFFNKLKDRLRSSEYWNEKTRENEKTIQGLICPVCEDKNAWCYFDKPFSINCNRLNNCGSKTKTLSLFPDIIQKIENDYPSIPEDPERPARKYLESRGLSESINGLSYRYEPNIRKRGCGGVLFELKNGKNETIWNGRIFSPKEGLDKGHNIGSTSDALWEHPGIEYDKEKPLYVTEGVIDALSLIEIGYQAVAVLAAGQKPDNYISRLLDFKQIRIAFDNDKTGKAAAFKWVDHFKDELDLNDKEDEAKQVDEETELKNLLEKVIAWAADIGFPFTMEGLSSLSKTIERLPKRLRDIGKKEVDNIAKDLLNNERVGKHRIKEGTGQAKYLDIPSGKFGKSEGILSEGRAPNYKEEETEKAAHGTRIEDERIASILPPCKDWNDYLSSFDFDSGKAKVDFNSNLSDFLSEGYLSLLLESENYTKYGIQFYASKEYAAGLFIHKNQTFFSSLNEKNGYVKTTKLCDFAVSVNHFNLEQKIERKPEYTYSLTVKGNSISKKFDANAEELVSSKTLREMFLIRCNEAWPFHNPASEALTSMITRSKVPTVKPLSFLGYEKENDCYVFPSFAINSTGKILTLKKDEDFFRIKHNEFLRPKIHDDLKPITPIFKTNLTCKGIYSLIHETWGMQGLTALSWVFASWFCNQIKTRLNFFPLLSLYGDTQTGKSSLTLALSRIQGFDDEGRRMQDSTRTGVYRTMNQKSNLFLAWLESDKDRRSKFDFNWVLTAYNDVPLYTRGKKDNSNETESQKFLGTAMFVQNVEPFINRQQKERVISVRFDRKDITEATRESFNNLFKIQLSDMPVFMIEVLKRRNEIEKKWEDEYKRAGEEIIKKISDNRLSGNYGIILSSGRMLADMVGRSDIKENLKSYILEIAEEKKKSAIEAEASIADAVFDLFFFNKPENSFDDFVKVDNRKRHVAISVTDCIIALREKEILYDYEKIQAALKRHPAFKRYDNARFEGEQKKAYFFDLDILRKQYGPDEDEKKESVKEGKKSECSSCKWIRQDGCAWGYEKNVTCEKFSPEALN
jgi:hypothetical protein